MRKAAFIYNPASGSGRRRRLEDVECAAAVARAAGVEVIAMPTRAPGSAGEQAREAIAASCDAIFACGGDGTTHEVLQGMIEAGGNAALGIIPLGTANALARDLGVPQNPAKAAKVMVAAEPRRLAAGKIEYQDASGQLRHRYFTVMAGSGPDALLIYAMSLMNLKWKERLGMGAYYVQGLVSWTTADFAAFEAEYVESESGERRRQVVAAMMAVRIGYFGFPLKRLAPGAALGRDDFRVLLCRPPIRLRYLAYLSGVLLGFNWKVPGVELVYATEVSCRPLSDADDGGSKPRRIYTEADGELLGTVPARFSIAPHAFTLLTPRRNE